MAIGELGAGIDDDGVIADQVHVANIGALGQRMRRRILQVLRQHDAQRLAGAKAAVSGQKDVGGTPTQRLVVIIGDQHLNALLLAGDLRRGGCGFSPQSHGFFAPVQAEHHKAAQQNGEQHQANGDLEMAGNHGRAPVWLRSCAMADATAEATPELRLGLSRDWRSAPSGASSTATAEVMMLFSGRTGAPRTETVESFLRSSAAISCAADLLRSSAGAWALSHGRKRPAGG